MGRKSRGAPTAETPGARGAEQQPGAAAAGPGAVEPHEPPHHMSLAAEGDGAPPRLLRAQPLELPALPGTGPGVGGPGGIPPRSNSAPTTHGIFPPGHPSVGLAPTSPPI